MADYSLDDLLYLMSRLRDPKDGCPWDRAQDFSSIVPHTIEESYELADAIERGDFQQIREELGDVLFQVVFYSQLGDEQKQFDFNGIVSTLVDKLIRRHPHVFPEGSLESRVGHQAIGSQAIDSQTIKIAQVKQTWEAIKATERESKQQPGVLDDVPMALPALTRAAKLQKRASQVGFDWDDIDEVLGQLREEIDELIEAREQHSAVEIAGELGDVLFCLVNLARHLKVNPEAALRAANRKFENRFRYIEQTLAENGHLPAEATLEQMDKLWGEAKEQGL
ncbi:MAG: nucleoside triphosphate pyrophosphohydrolase [Pseudomonadales bacterium]